MYVIVEHEVNDPARFWKQAEQGVNALPSDLKLHHCFPTADGRRAVCLWEADSVRAVEEYFDESGLNQVSDNRFFGVENKEGVALPSSMQHV
jgi:hypothetical protein